MGARIAHARTSQSRIAHFVPIQKKSTLSTFAATFAATFAERVPRRVRSASPAREPTEISGILSRATGEQPPRARRCDGGVGGGMRSLLVLMWVFWANMLFIFGITTIYFVRIGYWGVLVSGPALALLLVGGWKLVERTRRDWNVAN